MYHVIRGGCETKHPSSFVMSMPKGVANFLILIIHTAGIFQIDGHQYEVTPGQALVVSPNTPYSYCNPNGSYMDDWLHFEFSNPEMASFLFPCQNAPFVIGKAEIFTFLIRQILWEAAYAESSFKQDNIDALFTVLVNHLKSAFLFKENTEKTSPYRAQLQLLKLEIGNSLDHPHSIKEHAKKIGVSESYFQHLYTDYFGISFQQDLIKMRIDRAKYTLVTTDLSIEQIAILCGYASEVHFYRQFKAVTGITPAKYRANMQT